MNWFHSFSFEYPGAFILLIIYLLCKKYCRKNAKEIYFSNVTVLYDISRQHNSFKNILELFIVLFTVLSLSSPVTKQTITEKNAKGHEILLTLDASESMRDDDRFDIMKRIVANFIEKREFDSLALTLFAQNVYIAVPFTYDKKPLKDILEYIEIGVAGSTGTSLYDALYTSGNLFRKSIAKNKICILLTDGVDTKKNIPLDAAIANVKKHGVKVYVIAVGREGEYKGNILKKIASQTKGEFFKTNNPNELSRIYEKINSLEKSKIETRKITKTDYYYRYPLFISLMLLILYIFLNRRPR